MKTAPVTIFAFASAIIISAVVSIPVADENNKDKYFASSDARAKRSGWGYYYDNSNRFSTFKPSPVDPFRTPSVASASRFYPAQPYNYYYPTSGGGQSFVWQHTPYYTYSVHQTHPQTYNKYNSYSYSPNGWSSSS